MPSRRPGRHHVAVETGHELQPRGNHQALHVLERVPAKLDVVLEDQDLGVAEKPGLIEADGQRPPVGAHLARVLVGRDGGPRGGEWRLSVGHQEAWPLPSAFVDHTNEIFEVLPAGPLARRDQEDHDNYNEPKAPGGAM